MDLGEPYQPSTGDHLIGLDAFPWRRRTVNLGGGPLEQFLVMNVVGNELLPMSTPVLGSGFSEQHAALSTAARLRHLARPPEDFSPSLQGRGFRFDQAVEAGSNFVLHRVVDEGGTVWGASDDGREAACREAEITILSRKHISELSFPEFKAIAFPVEVQRGIGRRDAQTLFAGDESALRKMLRAVYLRSPSARHEGEGLSTFVSRTRAGIANACRSEERRVG